MRRGKVGGWRLPLSVIAFIITVAIILALLTTPFAGAASKGSAHPVLLTGNHSLSHAEQGDSAIATAFDTALNNHDPGSALVLFSDSAVVSDPSNIACFPAPPCYAAINVASAAFSTPVQIRGWLQQLVTENVEVKEVGSFNVTGNHIAWTVEITQDEYRRLNVAPLVADVQILVQDGKIKSLTIELTQDSTKKLALAYAANQRTPYSILATGIGFGIFVLGLVFPTAAAYYISRVRTLFAAVPKLKRPWILLQAGVASLFTAILLVGVRSSIGTSISSLDIIQYVAVVLTGFFILVAMVLMKRVWLVAPDD